MPDTLYLAIAERASAQAAAQLSLPTYDPDYVLKLAKGDKPTPPELRERLRSVSQLHIFSRKRLRDLAEDVSLRREGILFLPVGQQLIDRTREAEALGRDSGREDGVRLQYLWIAMTGCFRLARPHAHGEGSHGRYLDNVCALGEEMMSLAKRVHGEHSVWFHLARVNHSSARFQILAAENRLDDAFFAHGYDVCRSAAMDCPWWVEVHRDALEYAALMGNDLARDESLLSLCRAARSRPAAWAVSIAQHGMETVALERIRASAVFACLADLVEEDRERRRAVSRLDRWLLDTLHDLVKHAQ